MTSPIATRDDRSWRSCSTRFTKQQAAGTPIDWTLVGVEHPDLVDEIKQLLAVGQMIDFVRLSPTISATPRSDPSAPFSRIQLPCTFAGYELLAGDWPRRHGGRLQGVGQAAAAACRPQDDPARRSCDGRRSGPISQRGAGGRRLDPSEYRYRSIRSANKTGMGVFLHEAWRRGEDARRRDGWTSRCIRVRPPST